MMTVWATDSQIDLPHRQKYTIHRKKLTWNSTLGVAVITDWYCSRGDD